MKPAPCLWVMERGSREMQPRSFAACVAADPAFVRRVSETSPASGRLGDEGALWPTSYVQACVARAPLSPREAPVSEAGRSALFLDFSASAPT